MAEFKKQVYVDFDGVVHSYESGWKGADIIPDDPVLERGTGMSAIDWLTLLTQEPGFEVCIYSSRSKEPGGIEAMQAWLLQHDMNPETLNLIHFPTEKGPAWVTIDDRALTFNGLFPIPAQLNNFTPWYKAQDTASMEDYIQCEGVRMTLDESGHLIFEFKNYSKWVELLRIPKSEIYTKTIEPLDIRTARAKQVLS
jgi:hypothetical protein